MIRQQLTPREFDCSHKMRKQNGSPNNSSDLKTINCSIENDSENSGSELVFEHTRESHFIGDTSCVDADQLDSPKRLDSSGWKCAALRVSIHFAMAKLAEVLKRKSWKAEIRKM